MIAIDTRDFCIPSDENDYDELVAFADTIAGIQTHEVIPVDVLDQIRAEIEQYQADCNLTNSDEIDCKFCDSITFDTIYRIIDKYRNEVSE